jgi:hypothetical protein
MLVPVTHVREGIRARLVQIAAGLPKVRDPMMMVVVMV